MQEFLDAFFPAWHPSRSKALEAFLQNPRYVEALKELTPEGLAELQQEWTGPRPIEKAGTPPADHDAQNLAWLQELQALEAQLAKAATRKNPRQPRGKSLPDSDAL